MHTPAKIGRCYRLLLLLALWSIQDADAQISQYTATRIVEADGLPSSRVHRIVVDRFGYLWVGTINGLARYDGYGFKRYYTNPNDSTTINGLIVWSIFEDQEGLIWVGAGVENLNAYDHGRGGFRHYPFKHLVEKPGNSEIGVVAISQDRTGRKYFGITTNYGEEIPHGLLYMDKGSDSLRVFSDTSLGRLKNVIGLTTDSLGNTWGISYTGLFYIDPARKTTRLPIPSDLKLDVNESPSDLLVDAKGMLWILTSLGNMVSYDPKTKRYTLFRTPVPLPQGFLLNRMISFGRNQILTATSAGLSAFDLGTKTFEVYPLANIIKSATPDLASLTFDRFGNIWAGSVNWGLFKFEKKPRFNSLTPSFPKQRAIPPGWISRFEEAKDGQIWFESNGDGNRASLNRFNPKTGEIKNYIFLGLSPQLVNVTSFKLMPDGQVLLSTNRGIELFNPDKNSFQPYTLPGYNVSALISQFYTDSRNNQWLASYGGLFLKTPGEASYRKINIRDLPGSNASSDETTFLFESRKHGLWILSNHGLFLYRYDKGTVERHGYDRTKGDIFLTQDFNSIYEDSSGTVWVGTWQGGLCRYNPETGRIKTYTFDNGLPSMSIQGILADEKNGNLWLSTFDGLCRFNIASERSNNYSIDDGIQGLLYADGAVLKTASGQCYFGGSNGITYFYPEEITQQSTPPRVYLTAIKLFNKPLQADPKGLLKQSVYETKEITLPYNQNNVSLEFIALHYGDPSKNRYAYRLENYDADWREVTGQREAFYPKLPPGKYVFHVKAANNNGIWNEEGVRLAITVLPPWWQTPWAYVLYGVLAIGLGLLANLFFRRRLLAREREKQREREREHAREIEVAYHKLEESHETLKAAQVQLIQSEKMASLGELTAGIAHEIQNPLNFVNNFAELNQELLGEMQQALNTGDAEEAKAIAGDVIDNSSKIAHHGKRADAIVKNMLQHSRAASGEKTETNLNELADEYLRLAYHGLRAKDKTFNATLVTDFDPHLPPLKVNGQDISRVLLNLINNAFYAVRERQKTAAPGYEPTVTVGSRLLESPSSSQQAASGKTGSGPVPGTAGSVVLFVRDNGIGIPESAREKIFQPFFTTKPTGEGTGLGLSLSYDIVKAHGGDIQVESKPGEYSIFQVTLPMS